MVHVNQKLHFSHWWDSRQPCPPLLLSPRLLCTWHMSRTESTWCCLQRSLCSGPCHRGQKPPATTSWQRAASCTGRTWWRWPACDAISGPPRWWRCLAGIALALGCSCGPGCMLHSWRWSGLCVAGPGCAACAGSQQRSVPAHTPQGWYSSEPTFSCHHSPPSEMQNGGRSLRCVSVELTASPEKRENWSDAAEVLQQEALLGYSHISSFDIECDKWLYSTAHPPHASPSSLYERRVPASKGHRGCYLHSRHSLQKACCRTLPQTRPKVTRRTTGRVLGSPGDNRVCPQHGHSVTRILRGVKNQTAPLWTEAGPRRSLPAAQPPSRPSAPSQGAEPRAGGRTAPCGRSRSPVSPPSFPGWGGAAPLLSPAVSPDGCRSAAALRGAAGSSRERAGATDARPGAAELGRAGGVWVYVLPLGRARLWLRSGEPGASLSQLCGSSGLSSQAGGA